MENRKAPPDNPGSVWIGKRSRKKASRAALVARAVLAAAALAGCAGVEPADPAPRAGDEIVVCGRFYHTGAPVVLWFEPGGYDAYRVTRRFEPGEALAERPAADLATPNRYGERPLDGLPPEDAARVRDRSFDLPALRRIVRQLVLHYDACGTSRECFRVLHDVRGLSAHFLLDLDGTIYQTLDVKERAWHAGPANDRSIGVEIANIGAYPDLDVLSRWYAVDAIGRVRVTLPERLGDGHQRMPGFVARPSRPYPVRGEIHGRPLLQYDFTEEQYASLVRLAATLCRLFPEMRPDAPRDASGAVRTGALSPEELAAFGGLLGHHHVTSAKADPGPAFDWERVIRSVRRLLPRRAAARARGSTKRRTALRSTPGKRERYNPPRLRTGNLYFGDGDR